MLLCKQSLNWQRIKQSRMEPSPVVRFRHSGGEEQTGGRAGGIKFLSFSLVVDWMYRIWHEDVRGN